MKLHIALYAIKLTTFSVPYLLVHDQGLLNNLHGVDLLGRLELHHQHFGVATSTNHLQDVKVLQGNL